MFTWPVPLVLIVAFAKPAVPLVMLNCACADPVTFVSLRWRMRLHPTVMRVLSSSPRFSFASRLPAHAVSLTLLVPIALTCADTTKGKGHASIASPPPVAPPVSPPHAAARRHPAAGAPGW